MFAFFKLTGQQKRPAPILDVPASISISAKKSRDWPQHRTVPSTPSFSPSPATPSFSPAPPSHSFGGSKTPSLQQIIPKLAAASASQQQQQASKVAASVASPGGLQVGRPKRSVEVVELDANIKDSPNLGGRMFVRLSVSLSVHLSIFSSFRYCVRPSVCLTMCLSVCRSVCFYPSLLLPDHGLGI